MKLGLDKCIQAIDRYLNNNEKAPSPRLVNVDHPDQMNKLIARYRVGENRFLTVSQYSKADEKAQTEALIHDVEVSEGNVFLVEFTTFWRLESEDELRKRLNRLLQLSTKAHVVVFCYQCRKILSFDDLRLDRQIYIVDDGVRAVLPEIYLYNDSIKPPSEMEAVIGIHKIPEAIETKVIKQLAVITAKDKSIYQNSQFRISQETSAYDALCRMDSRTMELNEEWGTDEQWKFALKLFNDGKSWVDVIKEQFSVAVNLDLMMQALTGNGEESDWLYFISLKLMGVSGGVYLNNVLSFSNSFENMKYNIVRGLLDYDSEDIGFWKAYDERMQLIQSLDIPEEWIIDYAMMVPTKGARGICYLTNQTDIENEKLLALLEEYADCYERKSLQTILDHVNPMLSAYLQPFDFKNELLNSYFTQYTWQKITNHVTLEFEEMVEEQAEKREYNAILSPRASYVEGLPRKNTCAYFMDAMGVEFLGYIVERCEQLGLNSKIQVCRAEIPTLTCRNKEFMEYFQEHNIQCSNVKALDEYKHGGENDYDYNLTKLPLHLPKELETIDSVLKKARNYLAKEQFQSIVLISDHGASRLAVISEHDLTVDVNAKGTHGGRVCDYSDDVVSITKALPSDDQQYYVIANYDRFRGGRKPSVETHGGATLEEVVVPIIVLTMIPRGIEIVIETSMVEASIKNPPVIKFYTKTKLEDVQVEISGKTYAVEWSDDHKFSVKMDRKTKRGTYSARVLSGDAVLASDLEFKVEKAGMKMRDLL